MNCSILMRKIFFIQLLCVELDGKSDKNDEIDLSHDRALPLIKGSYSPRENYLFVVCPKMPPPLGNPNPPVAG